MNKRYLVYILSITSLSGCVPKKLSQEVQLLKEDGQKKTKTIINANFIDSKNNGGPSESEVDQTFSQGLSRSKAVEIALANNLALQRDFQSLGIAHADLVQAGLFTNPQLDTVFKFPTNNATAKTNIEIDLSFTLSDLWQVPIKKKIASDELAITSKNILSTILNTFTQTKIAYAQCLKALAEYEIAQKIFKQSEELKNRIVYRYGFGYSSDLDINIANVMFLMRSTEVKHAKNMVKNNIIELRRQLGLAPNDQTISFSNTLQEIKDTMILPPQELYKLAQTNNPEIQIKQLELTQAQHRLNLARRNLFEEVHVGFTYEKDFEGTKGAGGTIGLKVPLFDLKQGEIAHAKAQINFVKKAHDNVTNNIKAQILQLVNSYHTESAKINDYQQMINQYDQAIQYALKHGESMQINTLIHMRIDIEYHEAYKQLLNTYYRLHEIRAQLEQVIGKSLE